MFYQIENFAGTYDFRCRFHHGFIIDSHIHEYSELLYCQKGICNLLINGRNLYLHPGEFTLIPPNAVHQYNVEADVICAVFSNDFVPLFFSLTKGKRLLISTFQAEELAEIFEKLPSVRNSMLITAYLNMICNKVLENGTFEKISQTDGMLYQKVISYISENFRQDISLNQVANTFGYNRKYLSSALHTLTGMHFSDFVAVYRIHYARELLKKADLSISEISINCGFKALNTFNRQFKKITSMTPMQYRKLNGIP